MDLIDEEYELAQEKRRQELAEIAASHQAALKRYLDKKSRARKLAKAEKERAKKAKEEIEKINSEAAELHRAVAKAAEAERALLSGYVDRELIERRDTLRAKIGRLERLEREDRAHASLFDLAISQGSVRKVRVPAPPRIKDRANPPTEPEHVERPNPKRFTGPEVKEHLVRKRDEVLLLAEEKAAEISQLRPKLARVQAELDTEIAKALSRG